MGDDERSAIVRELTTLGGKVDGLKNSVDEIKAGKLAICQLHGAAIERIEKKLDRIDRGESHANTEASDEREGAKIAILGKLLTIENVGPKQIVSLGVKLGRDVMTIGTLAWLVYKVMGGGTIQLHERHTGQDRPQAEMPAAAKQP